MISTFKRFLTKAICFFGGHRPVRLESELHAVNGPPRWRFRCGDCGERYWWP